MNRIDDLIKKFCPNGVQYKTLGEIGELVRGNGMPKTDFAELGVGAIHYGQIYTYYGTWAKETISFVAPAIAARLTKVDPGDVIITNTSENLNDVGKAVAWLGNVQIVTGGHATVFKHSEDPKYIAYYLQTSGFFSQKKKLASGTKVIDVSAKQLAKISIPIPPLEAQREIVRILDVLTDLATDLEVELSAELQGRQQQYNHYRDSMFTTSEDEEITMINLGNIADFKYGYTASAKEKGDFRFIRITDINLLGELSPNGAKFVDTTAGIEDYLVAHGDLLMARTGATFGKTMFAKSDIPSVFASFLIRIRLNEKIMLPDYYWHYAQSNLYWDQAKALASIGGQPQFNANALKQVKVPIPSLENQRRVVTQLDAFGALANDFSSELRAEIAIRRQQYDFYRDRLMSFEEKIA